MTELELDNIRERLFDAFRSLLREPTWLTHRRKFDEALEAYAQAGGPMHRVAADRLDDEVVRAWRTDTTTTPDPREAFLRDTADMWRSGKFKDEDRTAKTDDNLTAGQRLERDTRDWWRNGPTGAT
jgi:hypothetical protein